MISFPRMNGEFGENEYANVLIDITVQIERVYKIRKLLE